MIFQAPIELNKPVNVKKEWIDYNGHMNVAYYVVAFDSAIDEVNKMLGLGPEYLQKEKCSTFAMECRVNWLKEMKISDQMQFTVQLINSDDKRIHFFVSMINYKTKEVVSTYENMLIHINMLTRKPSEFPEKIKTKIKKLSQSHQLLDKPKSIDIPIGIRK